MDTIPAYRWLIAYAVLILILVAFAKLKVGYIIEYYLAVMMLVFILLTQYRAIADALSPFSQLQGGVSTS